MWAGDGRIWSAGKEGLFRGEILGDRLELHRIITATTGLESLARRRASIQAIATDPLEVLIVSETGAVFRWTEAAVTLVRSGRQTDPELGPFGETADFAPLSGRPGWILLGPSTPKLHDGGERRVTQGYVELHDDVIGPDQTLLDAVSVAYNPNRKLRPSIDNRPSHGTLILTTSGELFEPSEEGPHNAGFLAELSGSVKRIRAYRDHFVVVYKNGPIGHYLPDQAFCHGGTSPPGKIFDAIPFGDILIEVGEHARIRFLTTRRSCALE